MNVVDLADVDAGMIALVGGKAAGLGEMIKAGEAVPPGFCLTTEAYESGTIPEAELVAAYHELGAGAVAVRSSATAEDLPDASFAGQQDTILNVHGDDDVIAAVRTCWESLRTERAIAYRQAHEIVEESVSMAVVVQRMVDAAVAGVLFTANPITGCRTEMVVDAARGLGTAVVEGAVQADHYVLRQRTHDGHIGGCLTPDQLTELYDAGHRLQRHFGSPQDIEWAFDASGTLWLLQSRPITTLFPLPPWTDRPQPRVYAEFGHVEGMLRPFTPMGIAAFKVAVAAMADAFGVTVDPIDGPRSMVDVAGRLYLDITELVRHKASRKRLPAVLKIYGPRAAAALERVLDDPRFATRPGRPYRLRTVISATLRYAPATTVEIVRALARPDPAREQALRIAQAARRQATPPARLADATGPATAAERLRFAQDVQAPFLSAGMMRTIAPVYAGMLSSQAPAVLLKGIAADAEIQTVLRGMPHNVTTDMDLALWRLAANASEHRDLLRTTPPSELADRYRNGTLPDIGLEVFLNQYGHRGAAEADVGMPRWAEDPAPVFAAIANYLRVTDPAHAPDRRFAEAARQAEAKIDELFARARRTRPVRARLARFFMRRARALASLRELGKFAWLFPLAEMRRQLLLVGSELTTRGLLQRAGDIMFLDLREAWAAVEGADLRELIVARRAEYDRETRRRSVPGLLLSDGTDVEALATPAPTDGALIGMAAAPGTATGRARVVRDPAGAHLEPGEILVAPTTDPGWTPLFMTAGGLVTETGSPVAHGPTVAREYGIPAVICVPDATQQIHTGQLITINGAAGTVTLDGG